MSESRIMPERWFYGTASNRMIIHIVNWHNGYQRPLVDGERTVGAFITPPFQRGLVWTEHQKQRLIESIYMGMPVGALVVNMTSPHDRCDCWLLDGQQRTNAMCEYIAGSYAVRGWRYPDLPDRERAHFDRVPMPVIETNITDPALCREVYDRLVYGGTPHA